MRKFLKKYFGPIDQPASYKVRFDLDNPFQDHDDAKAKYRADYPIRFFFWEKIPKFFRHLAYQWFNFKWWFFYRIHPSHRYHVMHTGLKPGYFELEDRLFHVSFYNFQKFVEDSGWVKRYGDGFGWLDIKHDKEQPKEWVRARRETRDLYHWWTVERLERAAIPWNKKDIAWQLKNELDEKKEDQEMHMRLFKLLPWLW